MMYFVEFSKVEGLNKEPSKTNETVVTFGEHSYRVSVKIGRHSQPITQDIKGVIEKTLTKSLRDGSKVDTIISGKKSLTVIVRKDVDYIDIGEESSLNDTTPLPKLSKKSITPIKESQRASHTSAKGIALSQDPQKQLKQIETILTTLASIVPTNDEIRKKIQAQIERFKKHHDKLLAMQPPAASTIEAVVDRAKAAESAAQKKSTVQPDAAVQEKYTFTLSEEEKKKWRKKLQKEKFLKNPAEAPFQEQYKKVYKCLPARIQKRFDIKQTSIVQLQELEQLLTIELYDTKIAPFLSTLKCLYTLVQKPSQLNTEQRTKVIDWMKNPDKYKIEMLYFTRAVGENRKKYKQTLNFDTLACNKLLNLANNLSCAEEDRKRVLRVEPPLFMRRAKELDKVQEDCKDKPLLYQNLSIFHHYFCKTSSISGEDWPSYCTGVFHALRSICKEQKLTLNSMLDVDAMSDKSKNALDALSKFFSTMQDDLDTVFKDITQGLLLNEYFTALFAHLLNEEAIPKETKLWNNLEKLCYKNEREGALTAFINDAEGAIRARSTFNLVNGGNRLKKQFWKTPENYLEFFHRSSLNPLNSQELSKRLKKIYKQLKEL